MYSRLCELTMNENTKPSTGVKMYDWVAWFARFQWFSYLGMGFQLLSIELTLKFWHSVYYIGHLVLPIFGVISVTVLKTALKFILPFRSQNQKEDIKRNWFCYVYDNILELCIHFEINHYDILGGWFPRYIKIRIGVFWKSLLNTLDKDYYLLNL